MFKKTIIFILAIAFIEATCFTAIADNNHKNHPTNPENIQNIMQNSVTSSQKSTSNSTFKYKQHEEKWQPPDRPRPPPAGVNVF